MAAPLAGPPVLDFSGSRADGWPVSTPDGVVARMDVGWGFRPDAWLAQQDGTLTPTQFVAAVHTHRRVGKRRRGAAASATT